MVVPQLQDSGIQMVVVLHPTRYDEATPCLLSALLGISITELQGGSAYTTIQCYGLSTFDVSCGIHQTIGRVCWDRHNATEIVHKEAIGTPLAGIVPSLESIARLPEIDIYVLDEVIDLVGAV